MAYIKFREMAHYFNFHKEIDKKDLPEYVLQYVLADEKIWKAYGTRRDKCVFTNKKLILFDVQGITGRTKKIHIFPFNSISSSAIVYKKKSVYLLFTFTSGYQMRLNYINLSVEDKKELRELWTKLISYSYNKEKGLDI